MTLLYRAGRGLTRLCFTAFGRWAIVGRDYVPPRGPLLVVANHLSFADPPLLVASLRRPLNFLGKQELFTNPVMGFLLRQWGTHPVDRSGLTIDGIRQVLRLLDQGEAVAVFPEGHRSPDHTMREGMVGAAYLAIKSQVPILPIGITGTEKIPSWRIAFPLCSFKVNIGLLFNLPTLEGTPSRAVVESVRDMMMYRIAALLPPEYRGIYAIPPAVTVASVKGTSRSYPVEN